MKTEKRQAQAEADEKNRTAPENVFYFQRGGNVVVRFFCSICGKTDECFEAFYTHTSGKCLKCSLASGEVVLTSENLLDASVINV